MDLLITLTTPESVDLELFNCWVEGKSLEEAISSSSAVSNIFKFERRGDKYGVDMSVLKACESSDQFNIFSMLEHFLMQPYLMNGQRICECGDDLKDILINKYWALDDSVLKEIIFRQKFSKSRKDLDEICEVTGLNIRRVTRQFDNLKNVFNALEDPSTLSRSTFHNYFVFKYQFSRLHARKYTSVVFLMVSKFNFLIKKRLTKINGEELILSAAAVLTMLGADTQSFVDQFR